MYEEYKALVPKPLLPQCPDFNETTFIIPPWHIPRLSVLQPPSNAKNTPVPCSDTLVEVDCELQSTVTLPDGTIITSSPIQNPISPTNITTTDRAQVSIPIGNTSLVMAPDGTETTLNSDWSSRTVFQIRH